MDSHLRRSLFAAAPVVLLPANGSMTKSPGRVKKRMKKSGRPTGMRAGCGRKPRDRQKLRYGENASVLASWITFDGIEPPLFDRNDLRPTRCSEGRTPELYFFERRRYCIAGL